MHVVVIGAGYVGLVAAVCLAAHHRVTLVERDEDRLGLLGQGRIPFYEAGAQERLLRNRPRLTLARQAGAVVHDADVVLLAVGTPTDEAGAVDLSALHAAIEGLLPALSSDAVLAIKSTVPVGTGDRIAARLSAAGRPDVAVVSNPEFLREGSAVADFERPHRVVLGVDGHAPPILRDLYAPFVDPERPLLVMSRPSAELTKLAANAALAARVAFVNEISRLAWAGGADIEQVGTGLASDPRIGPDFLAASLGFGGSCFPKDLRAIRRAGEAVGVRTPVLDGIAWGNEAQVDAWYRRIEAELAPLQDRPIAAWGLTFKAGTDDVRESAAASVVTRLVDAGARVVVHDPRASAVPTGAQRVSEPLSALAGAHALVIGTEWPEYAQVQARQIAQELAIPRVFDGRNLFDPAQAAAAGLHYRSIGRADVEPS